MTETAVAALPATSIRSDRALLFRVGVVACMILAWAISQGLLTVAIPLYVVSVGRTKSEWGVLAGLYALALMLAEPAWGWLSDRVGIALPVILSRIASVCLAPLFILTGSFEFLLGIQLARGAAEVCLGPLGRKAMLYTVGSSRRAMGLGLFQATQAIGIGIGLILGGFILTAWGYPPAFLTASAISITGLILAVLDRSELGAMKAMPHSSRPELGPEPVPAAGEAQGFLPVLAALCLVGVSLFTAMSAIRAFVPLLGTDVVGWGAASVAALLSGSSLVSGLLMVGAGGASDRAGRKPLILAGLVLTSLSLVVLGVWANSVGLVAGVLLYTVGISAGVPAAVAWVSDITPPHRQGQMLGLYGGFEDVGLMIGPLLAGFAWDAFGPGPALAFPGLVTAFGLAAALWLRDSKSRRKANATASY